MSGRLAEDLIAAGSLELSLGISLWLGAEWLARRRGWPPPGSWLRFSKLWGTLGQVVALVGCGLIAAGCAGR
jgi:hypothetical protein